MAKMFIRPKSEMRKDHEIVCFYAFQNFRYLFVMEIFSVLKSGKNSAVNSHELT